jgi:hypothetical protein
MTGLSPFDRNDILEILDDIGTKAEQKNVDIFLYITGGAAMLLDNDRKDSTQDVDVWASRNNSLEEIIEEIAIERNLDSDWLSTNVMPFMPFSPTRDKGERRVTGRLTYQVASPRFLLAMKMTAFRVKDYEDIALLVNKLKIDNPVKIVKIVEEIYGEDPVPNIDYDELLLDARRAILLSNL